MIRVLKAGPLTTVQDLGRPGYGHLAVPCSGAADRGALIRANRRVGNFDGAAGLEMTLSGGHFEFQAPTVIALCGAQMPATLDRIAVAADTAIRVAAGQILDVGAARLGVRGYLAVAGGIRARTVLGSRSTDLLTGLGPAPLRAADVLETDTLYALPPQPPAAAAPLQTHLVLRYCAGPRHQRFAPTALDRLGGAPYTVSPHSNRIGVRLQGAALAQPEGDEQDSEGLQPGAIQVPTSGQPLVFLYDHPVTGGYPVIGVVLAEDLSGLAQARPGSTLEFERVED